MGNSYKDCLCHFLGYCVLNCTRSDLCDNFINRSEWVHLPCNVGDMVWYISGNSIKSAIVKGITMDAKGIKDMYVFGNGCNFENSFDIFYLTHKDAEKALEEKKC